MLVPDVNVLINGMLEASEHHSSAERWLRAAGAGNEPIGLPGSVFAAVVRITTGRGAGASRVSTAQAFSFCDALRRMPFAVGLREGPGHWRGFRELVDSSGVSGPDITDAYLAAFAVENDATFITFDRGFTRFSGVRVLVLE